MRVGAEGRHRPDGTLESAADSYSQLGRPVGCQCWPLGPQCHGAIPGTVFEPVRLWGGLPQLEWLNVPPALPCIKRSATSICQVGTSV